MRIYHITIPLGLAFAATGLYLVYQIRPTAPLGSPVHPVTPEMASKSASFAYKSAPDFTLPSVDGKQVSLAQYRGKPVLLYFIKKGCPCSFEAEPILQKLNQHLAGSVQFVGVIGSDQKGAKEWTDLHRAAYPTLLDASLKTMEAYDSPRSVYVTLIDGEGVIIKQWPGWSRKMLEQANSLAAKLTGKPEKPFDSEYAPVPDSAGCSFYED